MEEGELDTQYQNQNVRGRQDLKKGRSLILFTVRNFTDRAHASSIYPSVSKGEVNFEKSKMLQPSPLVGDLNGSPCLGLCHLICHLIGVEAVGAFTVNSYIELSTYLFIS